MFPENLEGKRIRGWHDLKEYGVYPLTGEACGIGFRLLCDLSPEGVDLIETFLSIKMTDRNNSWNHSGQDGWKSIMLPRGIFKELAVFCLMREDFERVVVVDWRTKDIASAFYIEGFKNEDSFILFREAANKIYDNQWRSYFNGGTAGTRNRHGWTGRVD